MQPYWGLYTYPAEQFPGPAAAGAGFPFPPPHPERISAKAENTNENKFLRENDIGKLLMGGVKIAGS